MRFHLRGTVAACAAVVLVSLCSVAAAAAPAGSDVYLRAASGDTVKVTVGTASCSTTA